VRLKAIDPQFITLLLAYEDQRFYSHYGIDPLAMLRAIGQWIRYGKIVSGGSTITMQLAKLLHPRPRTISAKLIEMLRAIQLEMHYSKDEILQAYLTLAPYGGNIEGVVSASMRYFHKQPYALLASQMALLVALPQSPERFRPDKYPKRSQKARDKILKYAFDKVLISKYSYQEALKKAVPKRLYHMPRYVGHLAQKIVPKAQHKQTQSTGTTLNEKLQKQIEHWALSKEDVLATGSTLAILVVRNSDASIQAYLGSHNMFSPKVSGYIDMIQAIRSPGSTLKPFIYAHGFEKHIVHPNTIILDEEVRFADYMPHNFSSSYTGEVTLEYALQKSLNIPAVKILYKVGVDDFVQKISHVVGDLHIPKKRATLPIALGGLGLSMWQLTQLYVALVHDGKSRALHYLSSKQNQTSQKRLFDQASSKMTTAILRKSQAPSGFRNAQQHIAYKTGTSYGYRDAWTVAYTQEYTVTVWVGKPDNSPQLKRTGSNTAAPLAFEVLSMIEALYHPTHWQWSPDYLGNTAPQSLDYFDKKAQKQEAKLAFVYPQKNARFMSADCSDAMVEVQIKDGKPPYYWYIDTQPKPYETTQAQLFFKYGAHNIRIIDTKGSIISRDIWVNKPECE
jgi:penicillin-binding protein 1C